MTRVLCVDFDRALLRKWQYTPGELCLELHVPFRPALDRTKCPAPPVGLALDKAKWTPPAHDRVKCLAPPAGLALDGAKWPPPPIGPALDGTKCLRLPLGPAFDGAK